MKAFVLKSIVVTVSVAALILLKGYVDFAFSIKGKEYDDCPKQYWTFEWCHAFTSNGTAR